MWNKKHLRLRGENESEIPEAVRAAETPPLARRKRVYFMKKKLFIGNTSACAEKTWRERYLGRK